METGYMLVDRLVMLFAQCNELLFTTANKVTERCKGSF